MIREVGVFQKELLEVSDDVGRCRVFETKVEDAVERMTLPDHQRSEVGIMGKHPAAFPVCCCQQVSVRPALSALLLHIQHVKLLGAKKSDVLGRDVFVRKKTQLPQFHEAASSSRYTSL